MLTEDQWSGFTCGNAVRDEWYRYHANRGVLYEYLGNYGKAVAAYLVGRKEHGRLLELYEAADQRSDLLRIDGEGDCAAIQPIRWMARACTGPILQAIFPRIVEIRELEQSRNWSALADILVTWSHDPLARREYEIAEAVRLLARHPRETVPILVDSLPGDGSGILVHALVMTGEDGRAALERLYPDSSWRLQRLIEQRYRLGPRAEFRWPDGVFSFPSIPRKLKLPRSCGWRYAPTPRRSQRPKYACRM
jgi:hypothetical protein